MMNLENKNNKKGKDMKTLGLFLAFVLFPATISYGTTRVIFPATPNVPVLVEPIVEVPVVPSVTYSTYARPLIIMYDWVPYTVNHLVVTERQGLFCRHRSYHYEPRIEWVYQPVWK